VIRIVAAIALLVVGFSIIVGGVTLLLFGVFVDGSVYECLYGLMAAVFGGVAVIAGLENIGR